ncbi:MAG: hypothetical protein AB8I08_12090 [Sandaracinaceae bacterium]
MRVRRIQSLKLKPELAEALVLARIRHGFSGAPELEEDRVARAEAALDGRIPDSILAICAATERDVATLTDLTDDAREAGLDPRFIAFAVEGGGYWCVRSGRRTSDVLVGRWSAGEDEPLLECSVARFVRRRFGLVDGASESELPQLREALPRFRPTLRRRSPAASRLVRHAKFGEGLVLREIRDGNHKLEIQFAVGKKTIFARFVTDVTTPHRAA